MIQNLKFLPINQYLCPRVFWKVITSPPHSLLLPLNGYHRQEVSKQLCAECWLKWTAVVITLKINHFIAKGTNIYQMWSTLNWIWNRSPHNQTRKETWNEAVTSNTAISRTRQGWMTRAVCGVRINLAHHLQSTKLNTKANRTQHHLWWIHHKVIASNEQQITNIHQTIES